MARLLSPNRVAEGYSQACDHRHRMRVAGDDLEAEALVVRRLVRRRAEADGRVAVGPRSVEQSFEKLLARALAPVRGHDRDRQLRRVLVDEAEARLLRGEEPEPRRAVRMRPLEREDAGVARPPPVLAVAVDRAFRVLRNPPVVRVATHVAHGPNVVDPDRAEHSRQSTKRKTAGSDRVREQRGPTPRRGPGPAMRGQAPEVGLVDAKPCVTAAAGTPRSDPYRNSGVRPRSGSDPRRGQAPEVGSRPPATPQTAGSGPDFA